jgi:hypothetical protein
MHFDLTTVLDNGKIPKKRIIGSTEVRKDFRVKMADPDTKQDNKGNTKIKQNSTNYHKKLIIKASFSASLNWSLFTGLFTSKIKLRCM